MSKPTRVTVARVLLLGGLVLVAVTPGPSGRAQQTQPRPISPTPGAMGNDHEENEMATRMAAAQARGQNTERQKKIVSDTDRLLSLATELKEQVSKSDKNTMSLDVIKKADEIEKLAHNVKERMKG